MDQSRYSTVMVIDDNKIDRMLLEHMLLSMNYAKEVMSFEEPKKALDYLRNKHIIKIPEIIFLDLNLPIMNGYEFLNAFKYLPKEITSGIKVILVTSSSDERDIQKSSEYSRVIQYIIKPIKKIDLEVFPNDQIAAG
jgi:response regulator RpfG family c-di-GMP phosphodiesterase